MTTVVFDTLPDALKEKHFSHLGDFYRFITEQNLVTEYGELDEGEITSDIRSAHLISQSKNPTLRTNI